MKSNGEEEARRWLVRQVRFERLLDELHTRPPRPPQNGACRPESD
jgi:hypothetical protein